MNLIDFESKNSKYKRLQLSHYDKVYFADTLGGIRDERKIKDLLDTDVLKEDAQNEIT